LTGIGKVVLGLLAITAGGAVVAALVGAESVSETLAAAVVLIVLFLMADKLRPASFDWDDWRHRRRPPRYAQKRRRRNR
jgi:hypothetical protein